jgi:DNA-binding transcriptional LysR family regulator
MKNTPQNTVNNLEDPFIRLPYFDWDKAKYFYYVAKMGSLSETGKFLNISQPSLSRKIIILEEHLKCKLFTRTSKGLELTRKGEELFTIIERTFLELKGFSYNTAVTTNNGQKRKIRISTTHPIAAYILNEHLLAYNTLCPEIIFEVIADDQTIDIIINDVDLAIRPYDTEVKGLQQDPLFTLKKKLYASSKYLEKYGEPKRVEELKNHYIVAQTDPKTHPYSDIHWILKLGIEEGERHTPIFTSNSLECLIEAVIEGKGIISCYEEMKIVRNNGLKQILPSITGEAVTWYCTYSKSLSGDKDFQNFKDYILNRFIL